MVVFIQGMRSAVIWFPGGFPETILADGICMAVVDGPVCMRVALIRISAGVTHR